MSTPSDTATVIGQELALLVPAVRSDRAAVLSLLHDAFREFGASGRTWDRAGIAATLTDDPGPGAKADDVHAVSLGDGTILLTYTAHLPGRVTLRSSLWVRTDAGWKLLFHQGTVVP